MKMVLLLYFAQLYWFDYDWKLLFLGCGFSYGGFSDHSALYCQLSILSLSLHTHIFFAGWGD